MQTVPMDLATTAIWLTRYRQEAYTMVNRILVPLDGSLLASWVIPWADELADALDATVELVNVVAPPIARGHPSRETSHEPGGTTLASTILADAAERFRQAARVETTTLRGAPGRRIAEHARATRADLIVMTSHGRYGLQRALLGSVASTVVHESGIPVWVIRGDLAAGPPSLPRRVLVPLQGTEPRRDALFAVLPLTQRLGWALTLLAVIPFLSTLRPEPACMVPVGVPTEDQVLDAVAYLRRIAHGLRARGVVADVLVRAGDPVREIIDAADASGIDLIAMSTAGPQGVDQLTTNGVVDAVLAEADRPLLVLPSSPALLQAALSALPMEHSVPMPVDDFRPLLRGNDPHSCPRGQVVNGILHSSPPTGDLESPGRSLTPPAHDKEEGDHATVT
jgi:nucleotide-binding universal stress UspA family protein